MGASNGAWQAGGLACGRRVRAPASGAIGQRERRRAAGAATGGKAGSMQERRWVAGTLVDDHEEDEWRLARAAHRGNRGRWQGTDTNCSSIQHSSSLAAIISSSLRTRLETSAASTTGQGQRMSWGKPWGGLSVLPTIFMARLGPLYLQTM
ncbi:unnamed protein product [Urochloa humidicola]